VAMGQPTTKYLEEKCHKNNVIMVKVIIPHVIMVGAFLTKVSLLWIVPLCRRFDPGGVPGPTSKLSLRVPAQMGRRDMEHKG
jgi:hypothetical protein